MRKTDIILSIVIPTRNRAEFLRQMLDSLIPQLITWGREKFHMVIANNASTDNTDMVVSNIQREYGISIEYYKHKENIGLQNLDFVASKAIGKYTLLSGDDDIFAPNFISTIAPYLEADSTYSLIHWNRLEGDKNCSNTRIYNPIYSQTISEYSTPGEFLRDTLSSTNFVSSLIYNTSCWQCVKDENIPEDWDGYRTWGRILLGTANLNEKCLFFYFPLVIQRNPSKEWASKWSYYAIYEISNIFERLDKTYPGLLNAWIERLHDVNYYNIQAMIDAVIADIEYYRGNQYEMERYLTAEEVSRLRMWLTAKNAKKKQRIVHKIERIKRIVKKFRK